MPRDPVVKIKPKRVLATGRVDEVVVKRLEARGVDVSKLIEKTLNQAAGHYTCLCCGSLLKLKKKEG